MKTSKPNTTSKIELKNKLRSLSISQIRDIKLGKYLAVENEKTLSCSVKRNEFTPKSCRKFSKDSLSPGYRKKIKTIIHKSSPLDHEDIEVKVPSKANLLVDVCPSGSFTKTLRNIYVNQAKPSNPGFENLKKTIKPINLLLNEPKTPQGQFCFQNSGESEILNRLKATFIQFKKNHYSILKDFNI